MPWPVPIKHILSRVVQRSQFFVLHLFPRKSLLFLHLCSVSQQACQLHNPYHQGFGYTDERKCCLEKSVILWRNWGGGEIYWNGIFNIKTGKLHQQDPENLFFSSHVEVVLKVRSFAHSFLFSKLHNVRKGQEVKEIKEISSFLRFRKKWTIFKQMEILCFL